jgi:hypothetical protein
MPRVPGTPFAAVLLMLLSSAAAFCASHSSALRMENRLYWKLDSKWTVQGGLQARLRDNFSEFYYRKLDAGVSYKFSADVSLPLTLRFEDRIRDFGWLRSTYLLFDPDVVVMRRGAWRADVRVRLQYLIEENSLHYIRVQPRLWRDILLNGYKLGWWVFNDFYLRTAEVGVGDVTPALANNFCTGFNLPLPHGQDLNLYYMLYTGRNTDTDERRHSHQACISWGLRFGGNGHPHPPATSN